MKWTETAMARAINRNVFQQKHLVMVDNCQWTGNECDLLVVTRDLRIIDVEIKVSRADLKADAKKSKWWRSGGRNARIPIQWPQKVWKHYYAMPLETWDPKLLAAVNPASGVLLVHSERGRVGVTVERRAKPDTGCERITAGQALDIARLAGLRMWDAYARLDGLKQMPAAGKRARRSAYM